jgi:hypothetical protein
MIIGAHTILFSTDSDADRHFLRDVLKLPHVVADEGLMIFGLPPSEVAVHETSEAPSQRLFLMCDDMSSFLAEMTRAGRHCTAPIVRPWGVLSTLELPSGATIDVYEPRHVRPNQGPAH